MVVIENSICVSFVIMIVAVALRIHISRPLSNYRIPVRMSHIYRRLTRDGMRMAGNVRAYARNSGKKMNVTVNICSYAFEIMRMKRAGQNISLPATLYAPHL